MERIPSQNKYSDTMESLPLAGLRVVDLSRVLAGPLCSMILGDLGADILKVERPVVGDDTRGWGPPFADDGASAYFRSVNRNKLSVTVDFGDAADRDWLLARIAEADVVLENYLPGTLARHGLDPSALLAAHPRLVWATISGFGPSSTRPGYDFVAQAEAGWMAITGPADGEPCKVGVALVDVITGKDAAIALLAALFGRDRGLAITRHLHLSLQASATAALVNVAQNHLVSGAPSRRWGNAHPNLVPYEAFAAADRPFVLAVGNDTQWHACVAALGWDTSCSAEDRARWATNAGRVTDRARLVPALAAHFLQQPAAHWIERLDRAGVPCGVIRSVEEAVGVVGGDAESGLPPATGGAVRRPPPRLGEHDALLRTRGWAAFSAPSDER